MCVCVCVVVVVKGKTFYFVPNCEILHVLLHRVIMFGLLLFHLNFFCKSKRGAGVGGGGVVGGSVEGDEAPRNGSLYFRSQTHHSAQASAMFLLALSVLLMSCLFLIMMHTLQSRFLLYLLVEIFLKKRKSDHKLVNHELVNFVSLMDFFH